MTHQPEQPIRARVGPWRELAHLDNCGELARLAGAEGANVAQRCRRFGISRKTGYKRLGRERARATIPRAAGDRVRSGRRGGSRISLDGRTVRVRKAFVGRR